MTAPMTMSSNPTARILIASPDAALHDAVRAQVACDAFDTPARAMDAIAAARAAGRAYAVAILDQASSDDVARAWAVDAELRVVACVADPAPLLARHRRDGLLVLPCAVDASAIAQAARVLAHAHSVEAELRQAQKLQVVGQIAAGVAHEINTPIQYVGDNLVFVRESTEGLVALAAAVRDALDGVPEPHARALRDAIEAADTDFLVAELPEALSNLQTGVDRITTLVRAMRELVHPGTPDATPTDLNRALGNTLHVTANLYRYIADVDVDLAPLPPVTCLVADLNQVFLNLIVNAAHAMEDAGCRSSRRGRLGVRTRIDGDDVVVSIADTGTGIPEAVRERIFDAFFTTKSVGRGTGQGLAISRAIVVERHGGSLTFDTALGAGTTFHVRIPIAGPRDRSTPAASVAA